MRRLLLIFIAFSLTICMSAQEKKKAPKKSPWTQGGFLSIYGGQAGSRNWAAGTDRFSFSIAAYMNLYANKNWGKHHFSNSIDLGYAMNNSAANGISKNDDKIDFVSKYGYELKNEKWRVGAAFNLRTQFTNGYDEDDKSRRTSGFFAPAYITIGPGIDFKPCKSFSLFMTPVAARWVVVTNRPYSYVYQGGVKPDGSPERALASLYGVDPGRQVRFEAGPYISASYYGQVMKNVKYKTRLDLNSDFSRSDPGNIDWYWTNTVHMHVNKWLLVTYNFDVIYDNDVKMFGPRKNTAATQLRSLLGVGFAAKF